MAYSIRLQADTVQLLASLHDAAYNECNPWPTPCATLVIKQQVTVAARVLQ